MAPRLSAANRSTMFQSQQLALTRVTLAYCQIGERGSKIGILSRAGGRVAQSIRRRWSVMTVRHVALVNKSSAKIPLAMVEGVAQALQTQVDRDFAPIWGIRAQVSAFAPAEPIPASAWPIRIVDSPVGGLGIHLDRARKPFAQVKPTSDWSVTASHELLEMLADPLGNHFIQAPDIAPKSDGHLVQYLVEVGDPCEIYEYKIDGVAVSDFITPEYYDESATASALDFLGRLPKPLAVPKGCYISWQDPQDGRWHQKTPDGKFTTGRGTIHPKRNPREDRDRAFGAEEEGARHDLPAIRSTYGASKKSG